MEYGIAGVIYVSLQTALLSSVRYWLYQTNLRIRAKIMYPVLAAICLLSGMLWLLTGGIPGVPFVFFRLVLAIFMYLLSCIVIKEPFAKHTLSYAFIMAYDAMLEATANYLRGAFSQQGSPWIYVLSMVLALTLTFIPCVRALKRMIDRLSAIENDRIFGQLCVICFSFVFMNLLFTFPSPSKVTFLILLSRFLMFFGMVGVYAAATRVMQTMQTAAETHANLLLTERRIAMQQSYYDRMISQMDEVRRMRHDLRHHRAALSALVKNGDLNALSEYLDATAITEDAPPVTGNLAADSILLYYMDRATALGINMETNLFLGRETPLSDPDLCVILGNLLENAVDAQSYVPPEKRFIRVTAGADTESFTLAVDNRFDGTLNMENGNYISRKQGDSHGVGIGSVRAVCEKYGGVLQLETDGDMFMAGVVV